MKRVCCTSGCCPVCKSKKQTAELKRDYYYRTHVSKPKILSDDPHAVYVRNLRAKVKKLNAKDGILEDLRFMDGFYQVAGKYFQIISCLYPPLWEKMELSGVTMKVRLEPQKGFKFGYFGDVGESC